MNKGIKKRALEGSLKEEENTKRRVLLFKDCQGYDDRSGKLHGLQPKVWRMVFEWVQPEEDFYNPVLRMVCKGFSLLLNRSTKIERLADYATEESNIELLEWMKKQGLFMKHQSLAFLSIALDKKVSFEWHFKNLFGARNGRYQFSTGGLNASKDAMFVKNAMYFESVEQKRDDITNLVIKQFDDQQIKIVGLKTPIDTFDKNYVSLWFHFIQNQWIEVQILHKHTELLARSAILNDEFDFFFLEFYRVERCFNTTFLNNLCFYASMHGKLEVIKRIVGYYDMINDVRWYENFAKQQNKEALDWLLIREEERGGIKIFILHTIILYAIFKDSPEDILDWFQLKLRSVTEMVHEVHVDRACKVAVHNYNRCGMEWLLKKYPDHVYQDHPFALAVQNTEQQKSTKEKEEKILFLEWLVDLEVSTKNKGKYPFFVFIIRFFLF
jgi:hypothetical protein